MVPTPNGKGVRVYGEWAGNPRGVPEDKRLCAEQVWTRGDWIAHQCGHKRGFGPNGELCRQHAKLHGWKP